MLRLFLCVLLFSFSPKANGIFMPDNDLHLEESSLINTSINEGEFNAVINNFMDAYYTIATDFNYSLIVIGSWKNIQVNAMTWRNSDKMFIEIYGGLARRLSVDAINMVLCHEMGHQVGGWPLYTGDAWAAVEGQSDYYAAHVCAKKIFRTINFGDQAVHFRSTGQEALCDKRYNDYIDREVCYRTMAASLELAMLLSSGSGKLPSFNDRDSTRVTRILETHPKAQCRLDTYKAAALCPSKWNDRYIPRTEKMSARYLCTPKKKTWKDASRPSCWFVGSK